MTSMNGTKRGQTQREYDRDQWQRLLTLSRAHRQFLVESRGPNRLSLAAEAHDAGLVPHGRTEVSDLDPSLGACYCRVAQQRQRTASALIGWEYRHPWATDIEPCGTDRLHVTAWALARTI